jgi:hypothetical protein
MNRVYEQNRILMCTILSIPRTDWFCQQEEMNAKSENYFLNVYESNFYRNRQVGSIAEEWVNLKSRGIDSLLWAGSRKHRFIRRFQDFAHFSF